MLINCPNCGRPVSDTAKECPHCKSFLEKKPTEQDYHTLPLEKQWQLENEFAKETSSKCPSKLKEEFSQFKKKFSTNGIIALLVFIPIFMIYTFIAITKPADDSILMPLLAIAAVFLLVLEIVVMVASIKIKKKIKNCAVEIDLNNKKYIDWLQKRNITF